MSRKQQPNSIESKTLITYNLNKQEGRGPFGFAQGKKKEEGLSASPKVKRRKRENSPSASLGYASVQVA
jgi:hypothetical protein